MHAILVLVFAMFFSPATAGADSDGYQAVTVDDGGTIAGRVTFAGTPPTRERLVVSTDNEVCGTEALSRALMVGAGGGVKNAVVNLRAIRRGKAWDKRRYVLGQTACRFEPHVLLFREGADLHIRNDDRIAHGVRSYGKDSVFNVGHPKFVLELLVEDFTEKIAQRKAIRVGCDLHPWMRSFIILQQHPYYAISGDDGAFELRDVPPGQYDLELWHETLGEKERKVNVEPGRETAVAFELGR